MVNFKDKERILKAARENRESHTREIPIRLSPDFSSENFRSKGSGMIIYIFLTSLLEYNCFTVVCQFLLYNKVNQLYVYIYLHIPSLLHLPPTLPIPPLQVVTKHRADLPMQCSCFPLAIYFTFGSVHMSMLFSHFDPAYPSRFPCPQVHSLCLCLYSCPSLRFIITIFFQILYICVSIQYLFFSF